MAQAPTATSARANYLQALEQAQGLPGPGWLQDIRREGARSFQELDFPTQRQEAWRFTNIQPIVKTAFRTEVGKPASPLSAEQVAPDLFEESDWTQLVFVDGRYSANLSRLGSLPKGVIVTSLAKAVSDHEALVQEHLARHAKSTSAFMALNAALLQDGLFVYIPKNVQLETPIHALYFSTGADNSAAYPRNLIVIGESSEAQLVESYAGMSDDAAYLSNGVSEIVVGNNARLIRHKIVCEGKGAYHLQTAQAHLGRDSFFQSFVVTLEGRIVRNELNVRLDGPGGECDLNGLYLNDRDRLIDNPLYVEHVADHCRSRMAYKGVLDDESDSVFTGKVYVQPGAQKTDSNQLNNNLLLSDKATIDTKPQLEIYADDVKCTHGATIGGFPDKLIFYFQSRGIDAAKANGILTYGFADEVVSEIAIEPLRDRLKRYVYDRYSPF